MHLNPLLVLFRYANAPLPLIHFFLLYFLFLFFLLFISFLRLHSSPPCVLHLFLKLLLFHSTILFPHQPLSISILECPLFVVSIVQVLSADIVPRHPWSWHNFKKMYMIGDLFGAKLPSFQQKSKSSVCEKNFHWILKFFIQNGSLLQIWFLMYHLVLTTLSKWIEIESCGFYHCKEKWE